MNSRIDTDHVRSGSRTTAGASGQPMSATEARQGRSGRPVLMVLVAGLVLALLAWGGAEWWGEATDPPAEQTASPPAGDNTPATSNAAPSANPAAAPPAASTANNPQSGN